MNEEEIKALIQQLKDQGLNDEEILAVFYEAFIEGKMDKQDLKVLTGALGYKLRPEFENETAPDPIELLIEKETLSDEEIKSLIQQLKDQHLNDEEVMAFCYEKYQQNMIDRNTLTRIARIMGCNLPDGLDEKENEEASKALDEAFSDPKTIEAIKKAAREWKK